LNALPEHPLFRPAAAALVSISLALLIVTTMLPASREGGGGFACLFTASRLLAHRQLGPGIYDDAWMNDRAGETTREAVLDCGGATAPTYALLALPLTAFEYVAARRVWLWAGLAFLLLSLGVLASMSRAFSSGDGPSLPIWLWTAAFALLLPSVAAGLSAGCADIVVLALLSFALLGLLTRRAWLVGLPLGAVALLDVSGPLLLLLLVAWRRWKAVAWTAAALILVAAASLPWIPPETWGAFAGAVRARLMEPALATSVNQSILGFLSRLLQHDAIRNPAPIADAPLVARIIWLGLAAAAVTTTIQSGRRGPLPLAAAALLLLGIALSPVGYEPRFVLAVIPIFVCMDDMIRRQALPSHWLLFGLGALLLVLPIPYTDFEAGPGWLLPLAYPRLIGTAVLWLVAIRRLMRPAIPDVAWAAA
jgi:hypothetical protein